MASDKYISLAFMAPSNIIHELDKLAIEFKLSRGNTILRLVQEGLATHGALVEDTTVFKGGLKNKHGLPKTAVNPLREVFR